MIHPKAIIDAKAELGLDVSVAPYSIIGPDVRIGAGAVIGAHVVLEGRHVAHDCALGHHVIVINYAGLTGHVTVEDHATVGGLTGVRPFVRIGTFAYVGGCSKVVQDVPPFMMVDGAPATARAVNVVGLRRGGIDVSGRRQIKTAFRVLYRSGLAPGPAIAQIKTELGDHPLIARLVEFAESSRLGIVSAAGSGEADEDEE